MPKCWKYAVVCFVLPQRDQSGEDPTIENSTRRKRQSMCHVQLMTQGSSPSLGSDLQRLGVLQSDISRTTGGPGLDHPDRFPI